MIPTRIVQQCNGGTFAGFNRTNNCIYSIIVAPMHTEQRQKWRSSSSDLKLKPLISNEFKNTQEINNSSFPALHYTHTITTDDYSDWYLPFCSKLLQISQLLFPEQEKIPEHKHSLTRNPCCTIMFSPTRNFIL